MDFDINFWRSVQTVVGFVIFLGLVAWAYSRRNAAEFERAGREALEHD